MSDPGLPRRTFEIWTLVLMPVVYGLGIVAGIVRYLLPASAGRRQPRLEVGAAADLASGEPRTVQFNGRLIYVLHDGAALRALDATCTHLSCRVNWSAAERKFRCPCHQGIFAASGERLSGPPEKPLRAQAFEVTADGKVILLDQEGA